MNHAWTFRDLNCKALDVAIDVKLLGLTETLEACFYVGVMKTVHYK